MFLTKVISRQNGKEYVTVLLRESRREGGKVKSRTIANLSHCKPEEIEAIRIALAYKGDLASLAPANAAVGEIREGRSVGALVVAHAIAQRTGIVGALGSGREATLALWQVMARLLEPGSRLSSVRLANLHAVTDLLGLDAFNEDDLYDNLDWLAENQKAIEERLFRRRRAGGEPTLFLYDVTSSYLEGTENELADFGYNRDKKCGKKQIVIGLLCDESGEPVCVEVFHGNTSDVRTFGSQVTTVAKRFGCQRVTFVGDRGMIKSGQIEDLAKAGFHYITATTRPQIESLLKRGTLQIDMFDDKLFEAVADGGVRLVLRRNRARREEIEKARQDKRASVEKLLKRENERLAAHPRASLEKAAGHVAERIGKLRIDGWLSCQSDAPTRTLALAVDTDALAEAAKLDGCYVIRTDLPPEAATKEIVHERYKDLALVEHAFRTMKTAHLQVRPVFVRTEAHTRGHVLTVMLAYILERDLARCWKGINLTAEEGLRQLSTLTTLCIEVGTAHGGSVPLQRIPTPRETSAQLLSAAQVTLPAVLPNRGVDVVTRKQLTPRAPNA